MVPSFTPDRLLVHLGIGIVVCTSRMGQVGMGAKLLKLHCHYCCVLLGCSERAAASATAADFEAAVD